MWNIRSLEALCELWSGATRKLLFTKKMMLREWTVRELKRIEGIRCRMMISMIKIVVV